jgi:hypothetical protein
MIYWNLPSQTNYHPNNSDQKIKEEGKGVISSSYQPTGKIHPTGFTL